jgi:sulfur-oxidizing protein SoxZ
MAQDKMLARLVDGNTLVKALIQHPMETGSRKDPLTGLKVPRHFIQEVSCTRNGDTVLNALWGWGVSKNPYLALELEGGQRGDLVALHWKDDRGGSGSVETAVR